MSYEDVSAAVGIRKASIHYHFATKGDLIAALIERYSQRFLERVDALVGARGDGRAKLRRFVRLFEDTLRQEQGRAVCLCGVLASELPTLDPRASRLVRSFYRDAAGKLAVILELGRCDRSLAVAGDADRLASLVFSTLEGALLTARADGGVRKFRALAGELYRLLGAG